MNGDSPELAAVMPPGPLTGTHVGAGGRCGNGSIAAPILHADDSWGPTSRPDIPEAGGIMVAVFTKPRKSAPLLATRPRAYGHGLFLLRL
jgi:hypothetical protein